MAIVQSAKQGGSWTINSATRLTVNSYKYVTQTSIEVNMTIELWTGSQGWLANNPNDPTDNKRVVWFRWVAPGTTIDVWWASEIGVNNNAIFLPQGSYLKWDANFFIPDFTAGLNNHLMIQWGITNSTALTPPQYAQQGVVRPLIFAHHHESTPVQFYVQPYHSPMGDPTLSRISPTRMGNDFDVNFSRGAVGINNDPITFYIKNNGRRIAGPYPSQPVTVDRINTRNLNLGWNSIQVEQKGKYNSEHSGIVSLLVYSDVGGPHTGWSGTANSGFALAQTPTSISWVGAFGGSYNNLTRYTVQRNGGSVVDVGMATSHNITAPNGGSNDIYYVKAIGQYGEPQGSLGININGIIINKRPVMNPISPSPVIDYVTISWSRAEAATRYAGPEFTYDLEYKRDAGAWTRLVTGTSSLAYTWDASLPSTVFSTLYFRVRAHMYVRDSSSRAILIQSQSWEEGSSSSVKLVKRPNKMTKISLSTNDYVSLNGASKPLTTYTLNGSQYVKAGSYSRIQGNVVIDVVYGAAIAGYTQGFAGEWLNLGSNGSYIKKSGSFSIAQGTTLTIPSNSFSASDNDILQFRIWATHSISGILVQSKDVDLATNGSNTSSDFRFNIEPKINLTTGQEPQLTTTQIISIDFNDSKQNEIIGIKRIKGINPDADPTKTQFFNCGFKLYVRDVSTNSSKAFRLVDANLFTNAGTWDNAKKIFFPAPVTPEIESVLSIDVLTAAKNAHLIAELGDLREVNRLVTLEYKIAAVDNFWREGSVSAVLTVRYDFRVTPTLKLKPTLYSRAKDAVPKVPSAFSYPAPVSIQTPIGAQRVIKLSAEVGTFKGDGIVFEWFPAYDSNNKKKYTFINGIPYIVSTNAKPEKIEDPITSYAVTMYEFKDNQFLFSLSETLSYNVNYFAYISNVVSGGTTYKCIKYRAVFSTNGLIKNEDRLFYLMVSPQALNGLIGSQQIGTIGEGQTTPFYLGRLNTPNVLIDRVTRDLTIEEHAKIYFSSIDMGGSQQFQGMITNANWRTYSNIKTIRFIREYLSTIWKSKTVTPDNVLIKYPKDSVIDALNFTASEPLAADKGFQMKLSVQYDVTKIQANIIESIVEPVTIEVTQTSNVSLFYLQPAFGTLALRANKIAVNRSVLGATEEALVVVGKGRIDGAAGTPYRHIMSVIGDHLSAMPNYYVGTNPEVQSLRGTSNGTYIGFYKLDSSTGKPDQELGSIGFDENGEGFLVNRNLLSTKLVMKKTSLYVPIGTIVLFPLPSTKPKTDNNWMVCDGRSLAKDSYPELHALLEYTYGGSGANFNLPNLANGIFFGGSDAKKMISFLIKVR